MLLLTYLIDEINKTIARCLHVWLNLPKFSTPSFLAISSPFFTCAAAWANAWASGLEAAPFMYLLKNTKQNNRAFFSVKLWLSSWHNLTCKLSNFVGDEQYCNEEFYFQITKNYPLVWFSLGNKIMYLLSQRSQDTFM